MIVVIGSGPAGIAAATALLARGCKVTMLDVGITMKPEIFDHNKQVISRKNPVKLSHGSDYIYSEVASHVKIVGDSAIDPLPSFAQGGLSNVWGAFSEPYNKFDVENWPVNLSKYYSSVELILNSAISAKEANSENKNIYHSSKQAEFLLAHWEKHRRYLLKCGFNFGRPKLSVKFGEKTNQSCVYCGLCQVGCPHDLIYSARHSLSYLKINPNFTYVDKCVVDGLHENESFVQIIAHDLVTRNPIIYKAKQVFAACGPIISTKIALEAVGVVNHKIPFLDSTHFLLPCLMRHSVDDVVNQKLHTLTQLFLKLDKNSISSHPINLQLYTFMNHYVDYLKSMVGGGVYNFIKPIFSPLVNRLLAIQGHLHSSDSHGFKMMVDKNSVIHLSSTHNKLTKKIIKSVANTLFVQSQHLGFWPISPMMQISKITRSFHYGASLPMRKEPNEFETDIFGKLRGQKRWHIVDATIFPSIPAGSITPAIMANAYRIATECSIYE